MSSLDVFVFNSLQLPETSSGFKKIKSTVRDLAAGSESPPRKAPRLDLDSDIASASRKHATSKYTGPITIQINGGHGMITLSLQNSSSGERSSQSSVPAIIARLSIPEQLAKLSWIYYPETRLV